MLFYITNIGTKIMYPASLIMMPALLGVFANCRSWNEITDFAEARPGFLRNFFLGLKSPPSHDTFRRFFSIVNTDAPENFYRSRAAHMRENPGLETLEEEEKESYDDQRHVAIDRKTNCNALNGRAKENRPVIKDA